MGCIFCNIANKTLDAKIVYEDDAFIAFYDTSPKAPVHILIIPKKHIESVNHLDSEDAPLIGELFLRAKKVAGDMGVTSSGYKLSFNVGRGGGQLVDHLHLHLMGGW